MENSNVIKSCKTHIDHHANNCSGFVKAVANDFGIHLNGLANDIYKTLNHDLHYVQKYGVGDNAAKEAAKDAAEGKYLVIGASRNANGHGHVAIITGLDSGGHVRVYGGVLDHPEKASKNDIITKKCWASYKLKYCFIAAEPPFFFGVPIPAPFVA